MYRRRPPFGAVFVSGARWLALVLVVFAVGGCARPPAAEFGGATQGTTYHIVVVAELNAAERAKLQGHIEQRLADIDRALSNYRSDSELNRFNAAPAGQWLPLGADLYRVIKASQDVSAQSSGAFDITIAPLIDLWGFGPGGRHDRLPADDAINEARSLVDYRQLEVDPATPRARKHRSLRIDTNGIAQGYTVDCLAAILQALGYRNFMVEVGGELRLAGSNVDGVPWRIGIEEPGDGLGPVRQGIGGTDIGITTAGDYHDYFERDGVRYSHTLDPATGRPVAHKLASVTVIASDATYADGMDTALEVLGPERGYELAARLKIAAYFIVRTDQGFDARYTPEMKRYLLAK